MSLRAGLGSVGRQAHSWSEGMMWLSIKVNLNLLGELFIA